MKNRSYFLLIQPNSFETLRSCESIILIDKDTNKTLCNGAYYDGAIKLIRDLTKENSILITYNGGLLSTMLEKFFAVYDYKNIISLMHLFASEYGEWNDYFNSYTYKKLAVALNYYKRKGCEIDDTTVNTSDPIDMIQQTVALYDAMQEYETMREGEY